MAAQINVSEENLPVHTVGTQLIVELELNEELQGMCSYYGDFYYHLQNFIVDLEEGKLNNGDKNQ